MRLFRGRVSPSQQVLLVLAMGGAQVSGFSSLSVRMTVGIEYEVPIPGLKGHPKCVGIS